MSYLYKREKKINLLVVAAGLNIGGAEVVVKNLVRTIERERFNVFVCCIKVRGVIGDELVQKGIDVLTLSNSDKSKVDYLSFLKLLKVIRQKKIEIVHTHTKDALADAAVCKLMMPNLKLVHTFHFGNYPNLRWRKVWIEFLFSRVANRLIAVGEVQRRQIRDVLRHSDKRIGRVWNGVSLGLGQDDCSFRFRIGAENKVLIGTIATFIEQKGLRDFLAVAMQFRDAKTSVRFVLVGDGYLRPELEKMRKELGLEEIVTFTGWIMNAAEVALPAFDVFFQPSLWEAMSIVILEAMAAGKPILATRVGENVHIIEDGVDGMLVEPKNVKGMVAALQRLIDDAELRCRLGSAAARKVARQFTVERMTKAYEEIYFETVMRN